MVLTACNAGTSSTGPTDDHDPRVCSPRVMAVPNEGATHLPEGTPVKYGANPPASGSHWPAPNPWGVFLDPPIPRERWVHNLEHGGVVLLYRCPVSDAAVVGDAGATPPCPDLWQPLIALRAERKPDKFGVVRVIVTADPLLTSSVAAVAWDYSFAGDRVDVDAMRCFIEKRYGQGPEDVP